MWGWSTSSRTGLYLRAVGENGVVMADVHPDMDKIWEAMKPGVPAGGLREFFSWQNLGCPTHTKPAQNLQEPMHYRRFTDAGSLTWPAWR